MLLQDQPVVAMSIRFVAGPHQVPGHAEVQEESRPVGPCGEPLAMAGRLLEPVAPQRGAQSAGGGVANDGGIGPDAGDGPPPRVFGEESAEVLDVRQLWHPLQFPR